MLVAELEEQFAREYTAQEAAMSMRRDFMSDPTVVELTLPECYLGSLYLEDDLQTVSVLAGSQEIDQPQYGLKHDYEQGRRALRFYKDYVKESADAYDDDDALLSLMMAVPDMPPYRPEFVNDHGESRRFEAPLVRADYHSIMTTLSLTAPPLSISHYCDQVLSGWTSHPRRTRGERMFVGRSDVVEATMGEGIGEALGSYVRLRFNPICPAGAAIVQNAEYDPETKQIRGHYEIRGKLYPFTYRPWEEGIYRVCPDEWVPRLSIQSFELMCFDLVSDEDFWPFGAKMFESVRHANVSVVDRLMPCSYRYVEYDPSRPSYSQLKLPAESDAGLVMHAGSSLIHKVESRRVMDVLGEYVALEPANQSAKGFFVFEQAYDGRRTGIYTTLPVMQHVKEPARWKAVWQCRMVYREGEKNAVKIDFSEHNSVIVFRSKQKPLLGEKAFTKERQASRVGDYPEMGVWTSPLSSKLLFDLSVFEGLGVGRMARVFTTFFLHRGVYTNNRGSVALEGVDLMTYVLAQRETGRLRALNDMCGSPEWLGDGKLADLVHNALGKVESLSNVQALTDYFARLFELEGGDG